MKLGSIDASCSVTAANKAFVAELDAVEVGIRLRSVVKSSNSLADVAIDTAASNAGFTPPPPFDCTLYSLFKVVVV